MQGFSFTYKGKNYYLSIFSFLSLLLLISFLFFYSSNFTFPKRAPTTDSVDKKIDIAQIEKPNYNIKEIIYDTDLEKFPTDYDNLINTLGISLSQHQKMSLLLYGETEKQNSHTSIKEAYLELIEKEIPLLIPRQYIKEYIDSEINNILIQLDNTPVQLQDIQCKIPPTFSNPYRRYLWDESEKPKFYEPKAEDGNTIENPLAITNFYLDLTSEDINQAIYKIRIVKALSDDSSAIQLGDFLNDLLIYNQDIADVNARARISIVLDTIVSNIKNAKEGGIFWKISVINGVSYVYPTYLSKDFPVDDNNFNIDYDIVPLGQSRNSVRVPILMYHHINPPPSNASGYTAGLYVSSEIFEKQLAYLVKKNYKSLTSKEFYNLLSKGKNPTQKSIMLTFDDATKGQYLNGFPLLKKYGLTGIFYVPSNKTSITYNQLREMANNGMIIESHSSTHIDLVKENNADGLYSEIIGSRYTLQSATGQKVITISYPGCVADSEAYIYVSQAGYLLGASCGKSIDHYFKSRLSLSRVHVFDSLENFKNILSGKQ